MEEKEYKNEEKEKKKEKEKQEDQVDIYRWSKFVSNYWWILVVDNCDK